MFPFFFELLLNLTKVISMTRRPSETYFETILYPNKLKRKLLVTIKHLLSPFVTFFRLLSPLTGSCWQIGRPRLDSVPCLASSSTTRPIGMSYVAWNVVITSCRDSKLNFIDHCSCALRKIQPSQNLALL